MHRRRNLIAASTTAVAVIALAGCAGTTDSSEPAGEPVAGGTLRWGIAAQPAAGGVDPMVAAALAAQVIMDQSYDTLLNRADDGTIIPEIAESWEQVDDLTYVFQLRDDVSFADGTALTADDIVYTFETYQQAMTGKKAYLGNLASVEESGELEVTFRLTQPDGTLINNLAGTQGFFIVGRDGYGAATEDERQTQTFGTGAFQVVEWQDGVSLTLEKNEHYWGEGEPYLDEIVFEYMPDEATRLAALQQGSIQGAIFLDGVVADQAVQSGYTTGDAAYTQGVGTYVNPTDGPLADLRVRQALSLALDRQALVDTAMFGNGAVSLSIPAGDPAAPEITDETPLYTRDVDAAIELLEEAGQPNPVIQLSYFGDVDAAKHPIFELMKQQVAEAGITLELKATPTAELAPIYTAGESFKDLVALPGSYRSDPAGYFEGFLGTGLYNYWDGNPDAAEAQAVLAELRSETDPEAKAELVQRMTDEVAENVLMLMPMATPVYNLVWDDSVLHGFDTDPYTSLRALTGSWMTP